MSKENTEIKELQFKLGSVEYSYESDLKSNQFSEEHDSTVEFQTLNELIYLLSDAGIKEQKKNLNATTISVSSVNFITESESKDMHIETLLMQEENYVECMQVG